LTNESRKENQYLTRGDRPSGMIARLSMAAIVVALLLLFDQYKYYGYYRNEASYVIAHALNLRFKWPS
jgi:hypothetical protein